MDRRPEDNQAAPSAPSEGLTRQVVSTDGLQNQALSATPSQAFRPSSPGQQHLGSQTLTHVGMPQQHGQVATASLQQLFNTDAGAVSVAGPSSAVQQHLGSQPLNHVGMPQQHGQVATASMQQRFNTDAGAVGVAGPSSSGQQHLGSQPLTHVGTPQRYGQPPTGLTAQQHLINSHYAGAVGVAGPSSAGQQMGSPHLAQQYVQLPAGAAGTQQNFNTYPAAVGVARPSSADQHVVSTSNYAGALPGSHFSSVAMMQPTGMRLPNEGFSHSAPQMAGAYLPLHMIRPPMVNTPNAGWGQFYAMDRPGTSHGFNAGCHPYMQMPSNTLANGLRASFLAKMQASMKKAEEKPKRASSAGTVKRGPGRPPKMCECPSKAMILCVKCDENLADRIFDPCGHGIYCKTCPDAAIQKLICPVSNCNEAIFKAIKFHLIEQEGDSDSD